MQGFMDDTQLRSIRLGNVLTLSEAFQIASATAHPIVEDDALQRCSASAARLQRVVDERRHVYGITTGFGPLANRLVDTSDIQTLQQNLVHHLASGVGAPYTWLEGRAIVLCRLNSILQGASGASQSTIDMLVRVLRSRLAPEIPEIGTVGASGDLTPLAHMVLCLQGRGNFLSQDGTSLSGQDGLAMLNLTPLRLDNRDGLALVNGTSAMTGVALCNAFKVRNLMLWSLALSSALAEVLRARIEAWSPEFAQLRPHPGQVKATEHLHLYLRGAREVRLELLASRQLGAHEFREEEVPGQDAYTLRCVPQVIGGVWDSLDWHDRVVETELNAVTDNPIFPQGSPALALHGGNFMGQHVALASDALANAITVLSGLVERQMARLCDEKLNNGLPAFLHLGTAGLNSGFMGAQVTATALVAEMRSGGALSSQSISTNAANQDVVSMGTAAARTARNKIELGSRVVSILALAVSQAIEIREAEEGAEFSDSARAIFSHIRRYSKALDEDRPLGAEIEALASDLPYCQPPTA